MVRCIPMPEGVTLRALLVGELAVGDSHGCIHRENKGLERWLCGQSLTCEHAQDSCSSGLYADARQGLSEVQISSKLITQQPVDSWTSKHTRLSNEHLKLTTTAHFSSRNSK